MNLILLPSDVLLCAHVIKMSLVIKAKEGWFVVLVLVNTCFHSRKMFASVRPSHFSEGVSMGSLLQRYGLDSAIQQSSTNNVSHVKK